MIKASEKFKEKLGRTLQDTSGVLKLPNLSPLQRRYYRDAWELLQRLQGMIYVLDEATEIDLKTDEELEAELEDLASKERKNDTE